MHKTPIILVLLLLFGFVVYQVESGRTFWSMLGYPTERYPTDDVEFIWYFEGDFVVNILPKTGIVITKRQWRFLYAGDVEGEYHLYADGPDGGIGRDVAIVIGHGIYVFDSYHGPQFLQDLWPNQLEAGVNRAFIRDVQGNPHYTLEEVFEEMDLDWNEVRSKTEALINPPSDPPLPAELPENYWDKGPPGASGHLLQLIVPLNEYGQSKAIRALSKRRVIDLRESDWFWHKELGETRIERIQAYRESRGEVRRGSEVPGDGYVVR